MIEIGMIDGCAQREKGGLRRDGREGQREIAEEIERKTDVEKNEKKTEECKTVWGFGSREV